MSAPTQTHRPPITETPVKEVMAPGPATVAPTDSLHRAWDLMSRLGVHHLPVAEPDGRYRGMIDTATLAASWPGGGPAHAQTPVAALLAGRRHPRVRPDDPVAAVAVAMLHSAVHAVAVTSENGRILGIVTAHDLIGALAGVSRDLMSAHHPGGSRVEPE